MYCGENSENGENGLGLWLGFVVGTFCENYENDENGKICEYCLDLLLGSKYVLRSSKFNGIPISFSRDVSVRQKGFRL